MHPLPTSRRVMHQPPLYKMFSCNALNKLVSASSIEASFLEGASSFRPEVSWTMLAIAWTAQKRWTVSGSVFLRQGDAKQSQKKAPVNPSRRASNRKVVSLELTGASQKRLLEVLGILKWGWDRNDRKMHLLYLAITGKRPHTPAILVPSMTNLKGCCVWLVAASLLIGWKIITSQNPNSWRIYCPNSPTSHHAFHHFEPWLICEKPTSLATIKAPVPKAKDKTVQTLQNSA